MKTQSILFVLASALIFPASANVVKVAQENSALYKTDTRIEKRLTSGETPVRIEYSLYKNNSLISSGSLYTLSYRRALFSAMSVYEYIASINETTKKDGTSRVEIKKDHVRAGLELMILPVAHNGFIHTSVSMQYSTLKNLPAAGVNPRLKQEPDLLNKNIVSTDVPMYFKSGEERTIDFCSDSGKCRQPDHQLRIRATVLPDDQ